MICAFLDHCQAAMGLTLHRWTAVHQPQGAADSPPVKEDPPGPAVGTAGSWGWSSIVAVFQGRAHIGCGTDAMWT